MNSSPPPATSLGKDAWRRLRRNPFAMAAAALLTLVVLACVGGPWLSSLDPSEQRPWLGAQPPGANPVNAWQENRLRLGQAAEVPPAAAKAQVLTIHFQRRQHVDYAITLRRGRVQMVQRVVGGEVLPELALEGGGVHILMANGELSDDLQSLSAQAGDDPPPALANAGRRITIRHLLNASEHHASATLDQQVVSQLTIDGAAASELSIRGNHLISWSADGVELRHWHLLGTDRAGRDVLIRILHGGRISLMVGLVATLVSVVIGVLYGLIAGYLGGRSDRLMMAVIDILYAIPFLFLVILLLVSFQRSLLMLFIALGAVQWLTMARIIRGQALSLRSREFVEAAQVTGASHWAIITRHLLPNCMGTVIVYATLTVPLVILQESFLAFIGLQVELGDGQALDSWGALVQQGMNSLDLEGGDRWWLLVFPSLAMACTLLALNILGDGLRDCLDPRLRGLLRGKA